MAEKKRVSAKPKRRVNLSKTAQRIEKAKNVVDHHGLVFDSRHQIFIAKLKRGEIWAINRMRVTNASVRSI